LRVEQQPSPPLLEFCKQPDKQDETGDGPAVGVMTTKP
jgi:hypothetical protein